MARGKITYFLCMNLSLSVILMGLSHCSSDSDSPSNNDGGVQDSSQTTPQEAGRDQGNYLDTGTKIPDSSYYYPDSKPVADSAPTSDIGIKDTWNPNLRPMPGSTASLRYLDLQQLTTSNSSTICIYGADNDTRPYVVVSDRSHNSTELTYVVTAQYVQAPAGIPLRVSFHSYAGTPNTSTGICNYAQSTPLRNLKPLNVGRYYTAVQTYVNPNVTKCAHLAITDCDFYPKSTASPAGTCPTSKFYFFEDGNLINSKYEGGIRLINLSKNASMLGMALGTSVYVSMPNAYLENSTIKYVKLPNTQVVVRICPYFLDLCVKNQTPSGISSTQCSDAYQQCAGNNQLWVLGNMDVPAPRLNATNMNTTFYVVGEAKVLADDAKSMVGSYLTIVEARDISDSTLPQ